MTAGVRRRLPHAERREQLLAVARAEFGRRGFHLTQMEHVASAADVSKALLYQHFASKEELFAEVAAGIVADLTARMTTTTRPGRSGERMRAMISAVFDYATAEPQSWSLIVRHLDKPEVGVELREVREAVGAAFAGLLLANRRADPSMPPGLLAANERRARLLVPLVYGALFSMVSWWLEHPDVPRERAEDMSMDFLWLGIDRIRKGERFEI